MAYNCLKFSMNVATVSGYILILKASNWYKESNVTSFCLLVYMSNVWKRYLSQIRSHILYNYHNYHGEFKSIIQHAAGCTIGLKIKPTCFYDLLC